MWASTGYLGLPSCTAKYVCQCLWRICVGSCYWWRYALSVYVAPVLETLDFKDRSEPLMRQVASGVHVPDQPRLHHPYVVAVADVGPLRDLKNAALVEWPLDRVLDPVLRRTC